jgi:opacity protein-like surface antigen
MPSSITGRPRSHISILYVDFGKTTCDATCSGGNPITATFTSNVVRGGLNYKF